jgi:RNA polymerase subunit RPABC4/transcription elongation factor Spt4
MVLKICNNCKHWATKAIEEPCKECLVDDDTNQWEPLRNPVVMPNGK